MSSGGGGGAAPVAPTYTDPVNGQSFRSPDQLNNEIVARQAAEKATSDAANTTGFNNQAANRDQYTADTTAASADARQRASDYFTSQGYDPNKFTPYVNQSIGGAERLLTSTDPYLNDGTAGTGRSSAAAQIGAAYDPNLGQTILNQVNSGYASKANNSLDQFFTPGFDQTQISDSWLDPAVSAAVSSQFDPLTAALGNAQKRGTLNDTGYAAAIKALTDKQTGARATVTGLGRNILGSDRSSLDDYISGAHSAASRVNANTADSFDPSVFTGGASNLVNSYKTNFGGDLQNAIGSTSFADLPSLLNAGGTVQGATDPTATNPNNGGGVSDSFIAQQALANQKRGLGSTGAF